MGRHQYLNEDEYEVNLKDFEPQPGELFSVWLLFWPAEVRFASYKAVILNSECRNRSVVLCMSSTLYIVTKQVFAYTRMHT